MRAVLRSESLQQHAAAVVKVNQPGSALAAGLGAVVLMPLLAAALPAWELAAPGVRALLLPSGGAGGGGSAVAEGAAASVPGATTAVAWAALWLAGLWLAGTGLLLARLGAGLVGLVRLRRAALADGRVRRLAGSAAKGAGDVRLGVTPAVAGPVALGGRRPLVLLPLQAAGWSRSQRRAVVRHELAHLRRGDPWTLLLAAVATALHWPNPLVWLAARHLRRAGEEACDQAVVATGVDRWRYADLLVRLARGRAAHQSPSLAPGATGPHLSRRVEALLDGRVGRAGRAAVALTAAAFLLLTVGAALAQPAPGAPGHASVGDQAAVDRSGYAARYGIGEELAGQVMAAARAEGVEVPLAFGLVQVESRFNPDATSPSGAAGLTQILPSTARVLDPNVEISDLHDPEVNLHLGLRLLAGLLDHYGGDRWRALLAYNLGARRVPATGPVPDSDYPRLVLEAAGLTAAPATSPSPRETP